MPPSSPSRILLQSSSAHDPTLSLTNNTDIVLVLASLLSALLCICGLAFIARCACHRNDDQQQQLPPPPTKGGIKKKVLNSFPKFSFTSAAAQHSNLTDCAICLSEFEEGEQLRALPQCGHGFHVICIDTWLAAHSSCPWCRRSVVTPKCRKCGASSAADVAAAAAACLHGGGGGFLP